MCPSVCQLPAWVLDISMFVPVLLMHVCVCVFSTNGTIRDEGLRQRRVPLVSLRWESCEEIFFATFSLPKKKAQTRKRMFPVEKPLFVSVQNGSNRHDDDKGRRKASRKQWQRCFSYRHEASATVGTCSFDRRCASKIVFFFPPERTLP